MAWEQPLFTVSFPAAKDLTTAQYQIVRLTTADKVTLPASAALKPIGILQNKPTSGVMAEVMVAGISKVKVGGAVSRAQLLGMGLASTTIPGRLVACTTATKGATTPVARALQGAAQAGDIIPALINFFPGTGRASS